MRVTVEKWTVTTLKKKSTKKKRKKSPQLGATATGATSSSSGEEANEYLLEEHTEQEQNLYGRLSSDEQTQDEELESPVDNPAKSVLVNQTNSAQSPFKYIQLSSSLKIPKQKVKKYHSFTNKNKTNKFNSFVFINHYIILFGDFVLFKYLSCVNFFSFFFVRSKSQISTGDLIQ